ncbi:MAG TPA: transaldolase family protein [archaeon]|nr:transaldolase family protein [archaeon]
MTMMISLDTGDPAEIRRVLDWGFPLDKITSNPTSLSAFMKRVGGTVYDAAMELRDETKGIPISIEALGTTHYDTNLDSSIFVREAEIIDGWGKDFVVKLPAVQQGFDAAAQIDFVPINFTLVFSQHQGFLTGDYGGTYSSPFVGRYDDKLAALGLDRTGMDLADEIVRNFRSLEFATKVLVASVRNTGHIELASLMGAHAITMPFGIFRDLQDKVDWIKELREKTRPYEPQKPRQPSCSGKFDEDKIRDYERELLHDGIKKFLQDAQRARYSII